MTGLSGTPLLLLKESSLSYHGEARQPMTLRVFEDRVECTKPRLVARGSTDTIRYEQIAQVIVHRGLAWNALAVETNGGGGFRIGGLKKRQAEEAKAVIDGRVKLLREQPVRTVTPASASLSLLEQLAQLSALRESGALTEDEFAAAKKRLLPSE
jgi:hypothetical protein